MMRAYRTRKEARRASRMTGGRVYDRARLLPGFNGLLRWVVASDRDDAYKSED